MPTGIYKRTPEHNAAISKALTGVPRKPFTPEHCAAISAAAKGVPKPPRTPEHCAALSKVKTGVSLPPEHCAAISAATKGVPRKPFTPERCAALSAAKMGHEVSDETRATMAIARLNSDAAKAVYKNQRGGYDIVKHHNIYDHNDLSKYTIEMTRSQHTTLHNRMRGLNVRVPHINTGHETEDELKLMEYIKKIEMEDD